MSWWPFASILAIACLVAFNLFAADAIMRMRIDLKEISKAVVVSSNSSKPSPAASAAAAAVAAASSAAAAAAASSAPAAAAASSAPAAAAAESPTNKAAIGVTAQSSTPSAVLAMLRSSK
jgi:hypothetical protein